MPLKLGALVLAGLLELDRRPGLAGVIWAIAACLKPSLLILAPVAIADFTPEAARQYGEIRADLERRGALIGANDLLIAAHSLSLATILVTNNVREFERVSNLNVANWVAEE